MSAMSTAGLRTAHLVAGVRTPFGRYGGNCAGAAEIVDSPHFRHITGTIVRAVEVDPRGTRVYSPHKETT